MKRIEYRWLRIIHKVDIQIKNHRFYPQSNSKSEQKKIFRFSVLHNNWPRTRRGSEQLQKLQEKNPQIDITIGKPDRTVKTANYTGRTDVRISSKFLNRMMSDSQIAAKYENMLSKIPALDRWADSMIKSMTGSEVKYRQVWIDDEGNMGSMCIKGPSEAQKKENEDKKIEEKKEYEKKLAERRVKKEYEEWLNGKRKDMPVAKTDISEMAKYMMFNKYI